MTDNETFDADDFDEFGNPIDSDEADKRQKKKGGKTETGTQTISQDEISGEFYTYMDSIGAPRSRVAEIIKSWRHLSGEGLLRAIRDFASRMVTSRATAHVEVEIDKGKGFDLIHSVIQFFKSADKSPVQRQTYDQNKMDPK
ncbi:MAG: hypothetical protein PHW63_06585 [Alphaproteobacteria bacterium]|nr:hypothetical protein [Alphaproteobacteria bacterium]